MRGLHGHDYFSVNFVLCFFNRNEDGEDRTEKVEKGTKVKRTLSSLRNRVTGSFNKDKVSSYHRHTELTVQQTMLPELQWNMRSNWHETCLKS